MNKYVLMALLALSQAVAHGSGEKLNKSAHDNYIKEQKMLASTAAVSACGIPLGLKLNRLFWDKAFDEEFAFQDKKELRMAQYRQNPTWKQYMKNTGWRLGWGLKHGLSISTKLWVGLFCYAGAVTTGFASTVAVPALMYTNYKDYNCEYNSKKRA